MKAISDTAMVQPDRLRVTERQRASLRACFRVKQNNEQIDLGPLRETSQRGRDARRREAVYRNTGIWTR